MDRRDRPGTLSLVVTAMLVAVCVGEAQSPPADGVVDRLGTYLLDYETKVSELAAEEQYEQWIKRRRGYGGDTVARRKLRSMYFLVRLSGGVSWYGFREVATVDGRAAPRTARPMAQLLGERTTDAYEEALAVTRENAKYNIGGVYRTINVPLQALELLHPQHRRRFTFRAAGREQVNGRQAAVIIFTEISRPTLISDGFDGDVLARGRVWVEPDTGAVLRTELGLESPVHVLLETLIRVDYQRDVRLQILVPSEMEERYGLDIEVLHGRASYRNYRRFETSGRLVVPPE